MIRKSAVLLGAVLLLPACDGSSPTAVDETLDEGAIVQLATGALEATDQQGPPLPSFDRLRRETSQAASKPGNRSVSGH